MRVLLLIAMGVLLCASQALASGAEPLGPPDPVSVRDESATRTEAPRIPGQYIVVLKGTVEHPGSVAERQTEAHDGSLDLVYRHAIKGYSAELSKGAVEALRDDPLVKYVTADRRVEASAQAIPTGVSRIGATENAIAGIDGKDERVNVDVAVIDTGVDPTHPDLNNFRRTNCVPAGEDPDEETPGCIENSGTDKAGHGTHVAGTIGALDNGEGVVGVAPGARIWSVRVLNGEAKGKISWILAGVDWVRAHAAEIEVANMSLGCYCGSQPALEESVSAAVSAGVVMVVAAGNEGAPVEGVTPAQNPDVITVSALADYDGIGGSEAGPLYPGNCSEVDNSGVRNYGSDDTIAWFSNAGPQVEVAGPGVCIRSTLPEGKYGYESGTSMASPHVAGAAALIASASNPNSKAAVEAIRSRIEAEGSQDWTDIWTYGNQAGGVEYAQPAEGPYDGVQEPMLDLRPQAAAAYTTRATDRHYTSATLNGGVNPNGASTTYQFEYGATAAYGSKSPASAQNAGAGTTDLKVSSQVSGLAANSTYHYRLVSNGPEGATYGKDKTFKTATTFLTLPPTEVEASSAVLNGYLDPRGLATSYQFEYGTTTSYGGKIPAAAENAGSGSGEVKASKQVTSLIPGATYHYRLVISNPNGTFFGVDETFTTPAAVMTRKATGLDTHRARLEGIVNPTGSATTYQFEWGASKEYGQVGPASPESIGAGIKKVAVSRRIEGLKPNTTYHFRIKVTNSKGTSYGQDETFTTATSELEAEAAPAVISGDTCADCEGEFKKLAIYTPWGFFDGPSNSEFLVTECSVPAFGASVKTVGSEAILVNLSGATCYAPAGLGISKSAPLEAPGCQLELHPGGEHLPGEYRGSMDLLGCEGLRVAFLNSGGNSYCTITLEPQNGLAARYREITLGSGKSGIRADLSSTMSYSQHGGLCPDGTFVPGDPRGFAHEGQIGSTWDISGQVGGQPSGLHLRQAVQSAVTGAASSVGSVEATLNGTVDPQGQATNYQFEYADEAHYQPDSSQPYGAGGVAPAAPASAGSGTGAVPVSATINGLSSHVTYHYRLRSEGAEGVTYGRDRTFTTDPTLLTSFGSKGSGSGQFSSPRGIAVDSAGNVWVADSGNNRVEKLNAKGEYISQIGPTGSGYGQLNEPTDVAIGAGGEIWVLDRGNSRVLGFGSTGTYQKQFGSHGIETGQLYLPSAIAITASGNVRVSDESIGVQEFGPTGEFIQEFAGGYFSSGGIAIDHGGNTWLSNRGRNRGEVLNQAGYPLRAFGGGVDPSGSSDPNLCTIQTYYCNKGSEGTGDAQFKGPRALEVEPSGNVLVTDSARVQEFAPTSAFMTQFGAGQMTEPSGVASGPGGSIYVADTGGNRIQKWCAPQAPGALTQPVLVPGGSEVTLKGAVNPGCAETEYWFEYGTSSGYTAKVPATPKSAGSGTEDVAVSQVLGGVSRKTLYHVRLVARNRVETSYGVDETFEVRTPRFEAESYPTSLSGPQSAGSPHLLKFGGGVREVSCTTANLNGTLSSTSAELSLSGSYQGCSAKPGTLPSSIGMNGCRYTVHARNQGPPYAATVGVACNNESEGIEVNVYADATKQKEGVALCTYKLSPQTTAGEGASLTNVGTGNERGIEVGFNASLTMTVLKGTKIVCGSNPGPAVFTGKTTVVGSSEGHQVGVSVGGFAGDAGLFVVGEGSAEPLKQPRFEGESYPLPISGPQSAGSPHLLKFGGGVREVSCTTANLNGTLSSTSAELSLSGSYQGCSAKPGTLPSSIGMNGCRYTVHARNQGPPYAATVGVACNNESEGIEVNVYADATKQKEGVALCTYKLSPQTTAGEGASLTNVGTGNERGIEVGFNASLTMTVLKGTKIVCGSNPGPAVFTGKTTVVGS